MYIVAFVYLDIQVIYQRIYMYIYHVYIYIYIYIYVYEGVCPKPYTLKPIAAPKQAAGWPGGWSTTVAKVMMPPWAPQDTELLFKTYAPKWRNLFATSTGRINIKLDGVLSAGMWAIPPASKQGEESGLFFGTLLT